MTPQDQFECFGQVVNQVPSIRNLKCRRCAYLS
jgi:hypothetical protein